MSGRRVSVKTGRVYHIEFDPPKHEGRCDVDGSRLVQREDDREETVRKRLEVYRAQTRPLIEYYGKWAASGDARAPRCRRISGTGKVDEIRTEDGSGTEVATFSPAPPVKYLPLDEGGLIDERTLKRSPARATVHRFWPNERDMAGYVIRTPSGWCWCRSTRAAPSPCVTCPPRTSTGPRATPSSPAPRA